MLGKGSTVGKLAGVLPSGFMDSTTGPKSPLGFLIPSSKGSKNYDHGGIGLGIVVSLDKPNSNVGPGEVLAKYAICGPVSADMSPTRPKDGENNSAKFKRQMMLEMEGLTSESISTRVYYEEGEFGESDKNVVASKVSPVVLVHNHLFSGSDSSSDFLSSCHLCKKALHGQDIYMYGGEKAFCSVECRQRQIRMDEIEEHYCKSQTFDLSNSPCFTTTTTTTTTTKEEIFFSTGVFVV